MNKRHDIGVARRIGTYGDAVEVAAGARWLHISGTPGLTAAGDLPKDIAGQADIAWHNVTAMLALAGMTVRHLVMVTQYLVNGDDIRPYAAVRTRYLGDARPASMLLVVPALVRPDFLLEISACAAIVDDTSRF